MGGQQSERHGGNIARLAKRAGRKEEEILDFSANINPKGPPEWLAEELASAAASIVRYPDPESSKLRRAAATRWGIEPERIVCGNGADELLRALPRALAVRRILVNAPAYSGYGDESQGLPVERIALREEDGYAFNAERVSTALAHGDGSALVYIGAPNNPTGLLPNIERIIDLARAHPNDSFCADEAFLDFQSPNATLASQGLPNLWAIRSLTKFWAMPGLRLGLAFAPPALEETKQAPARSLRGTLPDWPVNALAEAVGARALADEHYDRDARETMSFLRGGLENGLGKLAITRDFRVIPEAKANFLLIELTGKTLSATELEEELLLGHGIAVRDCSNFFFQRQKETRFIRVAVRRADENSRLIDALSDVLPLRSPR